MPQSYVKRILDAQVYDVARETPIHEADLMSDRLGNRVLLKREDLQPIFSFKLRGAYCKMSRLTPEQRSRGVIAASAGNHAQGVAMAAKKLRVKAIIVMPRTTPQIKIEAVRRLGARVLLHGAAYGRIFVGVQVRKSERKQFEQVLDRINFKYSEETNNPAYQLYLGSGQD
jgi:threonine dehydratase